jgi:hypothetical protein
LEIKQPVVVKVKKPKPKKKFVLYVSDSDDDDDSDEEEDEDDEEEEVIVKRKPKQQKQQRQPPQQRGVIPEGAGPSMSQLVGLQQELRATMEQFQMQLMQETTAIHEEAAAGRIPQEQAQQQIERRRQLYGHQIQVLQQHDHLQQQMIMQKQQQLQMQHGMQEDDSKSQHQGLQGGHQQMLQVQAVAVSQQLHVRLHQVHYTQQQPNMSLEQKQAAIQQLWQKQEQEAVHVTQQFQTQQHHLPPAAASGGPSAVAPTGV